LALARAVELTGGRNFFFSGSGGFMVKSGVRPPSHRETDEGRRLRFRE
jgi:hypothetical protein